MTRSAPAKRLGRLVSLGAELREDEFGIGQRLGATEADETDGRNLVVCGLFGGNHFLHVGIVVPRTPFSA
jgi:hypothetical protein